MTRRARGLVTIAVLSLFGTWLLAAPPAIPASAEEIHPVRAGDTAPPTTVKTVQGEEVALADRIAARPTVLIFYRGGW